MVIDKKYIQNLKEKSFLNISEDMENLVLEKFLIKPKAEKMDIYMSIPNKAFLSK
ncbi:hypothetical protein K9O30_01785 [Clostridium bowmanii]|uniref:hypothetical protein n=1 Tax=Clostridium bowmanii TaxID=132925 RepID=UPI001C0E85F7|nr:hypothetical protein [Clostridium bowmanii]MBU3190299.1 hypothetical protein [Clostridium bowmanii]MCA1072489.1 hypothetical protein [Clostridium bowmanii]